MQTSPISLQSQPSDTATSAPTVSGSPTSWENRIVSYALVDAADLTAHPSNFRKHPPVQVEALLGSLNDLGWIAPVIVSQQSGRILDGHLRVKLAEERGGPLPVAYVDLSEDEEREALLAMDPIAALATIDRQRLGELLAQVASEEQGIRQLLERLAKENDLYHPRGDDPGPDLDHAEELQEKWQVAPGHLYEVGRHRLLCGDVTDADAVGRLLAGSLAHICVTDPPWNVAYGEATNPHGRRGLSRTTTWAQTSRRSPRASAGWSPTLSFLAASLHGDERPGVADHRPLPSGGRFPLVLHHHLGQGPARALPQGLPHPIRADLVWVEEWGVATGAGRGQESERPLADPPTGALRRSPHPKTGGTGQSGPSSTQAVRAMWSSIPSWGPAPRRSPPSKREGCVMPSSLNPSMWR